MIRLIQVPVFWFAVYVMQYLLFELSAALVCCVYLLLIYAVIKLAYYFVVYW